VASHDGFTLADLVSYAQKHNEANGEANRDGLTDNHSWNNGVEGATDDKAVLDRRGRDARALLATLFLSRGSLMLTAGDELGRTQKGNNNAYCQDNDITFLDWLDADETLADFVAGLSALRRRSALLRQDEFLTGKAAKSGAPADVEWLHPSGRAMRDEDWAQADAFGMMLSFSREDGIDNCFCLIVNRSPRPVSFALAEDKPDPWLCVLDSAAGFVGDRKTSATRKLMIEARSVAAFTPA
jgi:glycogen operon protein